MAFTAAVSIAIAIAGIVLADAHGGDHALALAHIDDAHAARGASRDANSLHRTADQRAAIGHQHDLVAVPHRECRHDLAAPGHVHQLYALAAAAGHSIFVGRGTLAETGRRDGEDELLLGLQLVEALGRESGGKRRPPPPRPRPLPAAIRGPLPLARRARLAQVAVTLFRRDALL